MRPLAVIMSIYGKDTLEYVSLSVESVLNQTFSGFDFYIQCDGILNSDVDSFLSGLKDNRVRLYKRTENLGLARSLNDLLEVVLPQGYEFIARMDADDLNESNRFERQMQYLNAHPEIDCLGTWAIEVTSSGDEFFRKIMPETHDECKRLFKKRDCVIHPTVMFRRSFFEKAGLYSMDTYFAEDTLLWAKGFESGCRFGNVPEFLYRFRLDDGFFERRRGWKHALAILKLRHKVNRMLHYGLLADFWAVAYAVVKLMPTPVLNLIYRKGR